MINRNSLTHYAMVAKLIKASREAMKRGYSVVRNSKGGHTATVYKLPQGRIVVLARGGRDITALVSSVLFD